MSTIDIFKNTSLDEKHDSAERFIQALDENEIEGSLRELLIQHFFDDWQKIFNRGISELEKALSATREHDSESEKCIAFLLSLQIKLSDNYCFRLSGYKGTSETDRHTVFLNLARGVAKHYFPESPFAFFNSGLNKCTTNHYNQFVDCFYGNDFCFTQKFFDDNALSSDGRDRTAILWEYFNSIASLLDVDGSSLLKDFTAVATSSFIAGPTTKGSFKIQQGIEFIKAWVKYDAIAGKLPDSFLSFLYDPRSPWVNIESLFCNEDINSEEKESLNNWLRNIKLELQELYVVSTDLDHLPSEKYQQWVLELNSHFTGIKGSIYQEYDYDESRKKRDEINEQINKAFNELSSQLSPLQIDTWIHWCINEDFGHIFKSKGSFNSLSESQKWCTESYFEKWKTVFLDELETLNFEQRLPVLSARLLFEDGQPEEFYSEKSSWWKALFCSEIEKGDYPKDLVPDWTCAAIYRSLEHEIYLPYIDKSIGVLRGRLQNSEISQDEIKAYDEKLEKLLLSLDKHNPTKALRHRLLLLRSSSVPFSNDSISRFSSSSSDYSCKWYYSLPDLAKSQFGYQVNGKVGITSENYSQIEHDSYLDFSYALAEFCLSRLRLRKGEKTKDEQYEASQVIEQSSIWRKGYLKALTEIGFDLGGTVHKTVNFTKKSDPDEAVRDTASECYKAVRRNAKKNPSLQDLKRGIISAEWWLLICQRQALNLDINYDEAIKTRRRLLRNP